MTDDKTETFAKYHDEHAGYGVMPGEFHARAATFLRDQAAKIRALEADNAAFLQVVRNAGAGGCEEFETCGDCLACAAAALSASTHPGAALLAQMEKDRETIRELREALGNVSTTLESKDLRHYARDDTNLASKQMAVIEDAWRIARTAYDKGTP